MCGIFGLIDYDNAFEAIYNALVQLQHRGQDAAGIFLYDEESQECIIHKDRGLVSPVFSGHSMIDSKARWGIGHVRYTTVGSGTVHDAQPLLSSGDPAISIAYNGNIVNYLPLKRQLESEGALFQTGCDAEVILHTFKRALIGKPMTFQAICHAVKGVYTHVKGAYSVLLMIQGVGLVAFRDPHGLRPLLVGRCGTGFAFASEINALSVTGCVDVGEVGGAEVYFVDAKSVLHKAVLQKIKHAHCSFEFNYFSKPNTFFEGTEVYQVRKSLGRILAEKIRAKGIEIDAVIPIPSSARAAAVALAHTLNLPYEEGFVKQDNIGRTFIMPTQGVRQKSLYRKLAPVHSCFHGKRVLLVDDSIVRGTVSKRVVKLARQSAPEKIYFASTFPPIRHACLYGIDFPHTEQLIARGNTIDEIAKEIGVDALFYNTEDDLRRAAQMEDLCFACVDGNYPMEMEGMEDLQKRRKEDMELLCKK